jgi:hypothetical protein
MFSNYGTKHSWNVQKLLLPIKPVNSKMKSILDNGHRTLETYIYPTLGDLTISNITKVDIAEVLRPIWIEKMKQPNVFVVV